MILIGWIIMGETIITGVIFGLCALMMLGIGISQLKSKKPVGFYSGEKSPSEDEISDVQMWNKKHGTMWIIYGITIILAWICGSIIGDSVFILIPYLTGLLLPVFIMIWYHHKLIKMYKKK